MIPSILTKHTPPPFTKLKKWPSKYVIMLTATGLIATVGLLAKLFFSSKQSTAPKESHDSIKASIKAMSSSSQYVETVATFASIPLFKDEALTKMKMQLKQVKDRLKEKNGKLNPEEETQKKRYELDLINLYRNLLIPENDNQDFLNEVLTFLKICPSNPYPIMGLLSECIKNTILRDKALSFFQTHKKNMFPTTGSPFTVMLDDLEHIKNLIEALVSVITKEDQKLIQKSLLKIQSIGLKEDNVLVDSLAMLYDEKQDLPPTPLHFHSIKEKNFYLVYFQKIKDKCSKTHKNFLIKELPQFSAIEQAEDKLLKVQLFQAYCHLSDDIPEKKDAFVYLMKAHTTGDDRIFCKAADKLLAIDNPASFQETHVKKAIETLDTLINSHEANEGMRKMFINRKTDLLIYLAYKKTLDEEEIAYICAHLPYKDYPKLIQAIKDEKITCTHHHNHPILLMFCCQKAAERQAALKILKNMASDNNTQEDIRFACIQALASIPQESSDEEANRQEQFKEKAKQHQYLTMYYNTYALDCGFPEADSEWLFTLLLTAITRSTDKVYLLNSSDLKPLNAFAKYPAFQTKVLQIYLDYLAFSISQANEDLMSSTSDLLKVVMKNPKVPYEQKEAFQGQYLQIFIPLLKGNHPNFLKIASLAIAKGFS